MTYVLATVSLLGLYPLKTMQAFGLEKTASDLVNLCISAAN